jgi:branched-chain amino acid aminotransferase
MRSVILENGENYGFHIRESCLTTLDLYECDELFLTNAARGIQWIMGFRNKRYFNKVSGRLVKMINELVQ